MTPTIQKRSRLGARAGRLACLASAFLAAAAPAVAHPHVWVSTKSVFVFENGAFIGIRYTWLFDEMYTTAATEGLDVNKDGVFDASELAELTKVNAEGLKEFDYFTQARLLGQEIKFADPRDVRMEVIEVAEAPGPQLVAAPGMAGPGDSPPPAQASQPRGPAQSDRPGVWSRFTGWLGGLFGKSTPATSAASSSPQNAGVAPVPATVSEKPKVLGLHMMLPLPEPVPAAKLTAAAKGFQFVLGDGQMFIWFEPAKDGVSIASGAPADCRVDMVDQELDEQQKKLAEAFGKLGSSPVSMTPKAVQLSCGAR